MAKVSPRKKLVFLAISTIYLCAQNLHAQCVVPRLHHPWGRFATNAWKYVQIVTEELDENGKVVNTSTTKTLTKLKAVDEKSFTLLVDVTIEVSGQRFRSRPKLITKGYYGENLGQKVSLTDLGNAFVTIDGRRITSQVSRAIIDGDQSKRETKIHYSDQVSPYVLKRQTVSTNLADKSKNFESRVEVISLAKSFHVLSEIRPTSEIKTVQMRGKRKIETVEVVSHDVPGGVVYHTSKEYDESGTLVRRSTLELINYHVVEPSTRLRGRWKERLRAWKRARQSN